MLTDVRSRLRNLVEPPAFVSLFREHPPEGFVCADGPLGLPLFFTNFDLLTTLDPAVRARLEKAPLVPVLTKRLRFAACFAGTTITEYAPLPADTTPGDLVDGLLQSQCGEQSLTIIKDVPDASPLLSADDNAYAGALVRVAANRGFFQVKGQALAFVPLHFENLEGYFAKLSAGRRKDLRRKMKMRDALDVEVVPVGDARFRDAAFLGELYALYLEVYAQSVIHFDLLTPSFFAALLGRGDITGVVVCYRHRGVLAGYNICLIHGGLFIDKYIGFRYPLAREMNLYFVSWLVNLELALQYGCTTYVAGWTDPQVKAALGAEFTFTRHLVRVRNPVLRRVLSPLRHFFESDCRCLDGKS